MQSQCFFFGKRRPNLQTDELSITQSEVCVTLILSLLRLAALGGSTSLGEFLTAEFFLFMVLWITAQPTHSVILQGGPRL